MSDTLLIGLAMLRSNWDRHEKTFIDNFVPFVADCLRDVGPSGAMTAGEIQTCVKKQFGIDLPHGALTTVLNRAVRRGLADKRQHKYWPEAEALDQVPLARRRDDVAREIECLVSKLVDYLASHQGEEWTRARAEDALRTYVDEWSVPLLRRSLNGGSRGGDEFAQREADYLIGGFVVHLGREDPEGFRYLESLVKASMLTAGLYLDQGRMQQPFSDLTAFLDGPFLLSLLGVHGDEEQAAAVELVGLAGELGVETACFPGTLSEVRGVLQGTARDMRNRRRSGRNVRLHPRVATEGLTATRLEELADQTELALRRHGITLRALPRFRVDGSTDVEGLTSTLQDRVGYVSELTREHDVTCLAAVHQIRKGQVQVQLERARAIFVTSNPKVVAGAADHFSKARDALAVPVGMMDHEFATLLWLKKPTAAPDLPWKSLLADCHAALNPDDQLWNRYLDEIDELAERDDIDDETYFLARHGNEARAALMARTRGRTDRLDDRSVHEIVQDARSAIQAPADERAAAAEDRAAAAEVRRAQEHEQAMQRERQRITEADRRARAETVSANARRLAERIARVGARGLYAATLVGVVLGAGSMVAGLFVDTLPTWMLWMAGWLSVAAVLSTLFNVSVPGLVGRFELVLAGWLHPRFERLLTPSASSAELPVGEPSLVEADQETLDTAA